MRKFVNFAVFATMVLTLTCFVSCSSGSDDNNTPIIIPGNGAGGGNGGTYANTTWTTTAYVNGCTGKFTLTFDDKNGFVFSEKWSSEVWPAGMYPSAGSMSGTYKVEATKLVLTIIDTSKHGGGPTKDYNDGDTFELQISGDKLHYEAEDNYGSYTFTKSNNTQTGDDNNESSYGGDKNIAGKWVRDDKNVGKEGWWFFDDGTYYALYELYIGSGELGYRSTKKGTWERVTNSHGVVVMDMKGGTSTYDAEDNAVDFVVKDGKLCVIFVWDGETKYTFEKYDGTLTDFDASSE